MIAALSLGSAGAAHGQDFTTPYYVYPTLPLQVYDVYPYTLPYNGLVNGGYYYGGFGAPYGGVAPYSTLGGYFGTPYSRLESIPYYTRSHFGGFR